MVNPFADPKYPKLEFGDRQNERLKNDHSQLLTCHEQNFVKDDAWCCFTKSAVYPGIMGPFPPTYLRFHATAGAGIGVGPCRDYQGVLSSEHRTERILQIER
jgi:hypothetical protein